MTRWTLAWAGGSVLAVANGTVREVLLRPAFGEATAHRVSTVALVGLLGGYVRTLDRRWPLPDRRFAWRVGARWVVMTTAFEFGFGRLEGKSWSTLLRDYDVRAGRLWVLLPLWTLVAPAVVLARRTKRPTKPIGPTRTRTADVS